MLESSHEMLATDKEPTMTTPNTWTVPATAWAPIPGHEGAVCAEGTAHGVGTCMARQRWLGLRVRVAQNPTTKEWIAQAQAIGYKTKAVHGVHSTREAALADTGRVLSELIAAVEYETRPQSREYPPSKAQRIDWRRVS